MPKILSTSVIVDKKGGIRIPLAVRKNKKIQAGTILHFKVVNNKLIYTIVPDPIEILSGALVGTNASSKDFLSMKNADDKLLMTKYNKNSL